MKRIETELASDVDILVQHCGGSLVLKGWDKEKARFDFPHSDQGLTQNKKQFIVNTPGDCLLRIPVDTELNIEQVRGDVSISRLKGAIRIINVSGSAALKHVGIVRAEKIYGNLSIKHQEGNLELEQVHGNVSVKNTQGAVKADEVMGNLSIRDAAGNINADAQGNVNLRLKPSPGADYKISTNGNAYCRVEEVANVKVHLESGTGSILVLTEDLNETLETTVHDLTLGDGSATLHIEANGHIDFRSKEEKDNFSFAAEINIGDDIGGMVEEISDQVGAQMEAQLDALNEQLESLSERMQFSGDRAVQKAQRKVEAAQRSLENRLKARNLGTRGRGPKGPHTGALFTSHAEPVSEEERMKVLQMVQEKKISIQEAELLLASLEGRSPTKSKKSKE
jgi:hypothetical protein